MENEKCVYFIQAGAGGPIKIGLAADVAKRLAALQVGNPHKLSILGVIRCDAADIEASLHRMYRAERLSGEWFNPTPDLLDVIKRLAVPLELEPATSWRTGYPRTNPVHFQEHWTEAKVTLQRNAER